MYTDFRELVIATRKKYENAAELSRSGDSCIYSHRANGIGCAIGCHFPAEQAEQLDGGDGTSNGIRLILREPDKEAIVRTVISDAIDTNSLVALQSAHDTSRKVGGFLASIDRYLETGGW